MRIHAMWPIAGLAMIAACGAAEDARESAWLERAESGFVETFDGERIHYLALGERAGHDRPVLLFVPGWTMAAEIWAPQLEHFSTTHRVVAMDPRSQGRSSKARDGHYAAARARDIRAVVETLDLEPVVLIGWSMAVTEAVAYVDEFGTDGLAGLVLVDGVAGMDWEGDLAVMYMRWTAGFVHDRPAATESFVRGMYREPQSEEYLEAVTARSLQTPTDSAAALIVSAIESDYRATLPEIDIPVLVAGTTGSPWDPVYAAMAEAIPDARLERFEGAGHALFVDRAEDFNAGLEAFLREIGSRGPGE